MEKEVVEEEEEVEVKEKEMVEVREMEVEEKEVVKEEKEVEVVGEEKEVVEEKELVQGNEVEVARPVGKEESLSENPETGQSEVVPVRFVVEEEEEEGREEVGAVAVVVSNEDGSPNDIEELSKEKEPVSGSGMDPAASTSTGTAGTIQLQQAEQVLDVCSLLLNTNNKSEVYFFPYLCRGQVIKRVMVKSPYLLVCKCLVMILLDVHLRGI